MANLRKWLEEAAGPEEIQAVVIGNMGWPDYGDHALSPLAKDRTNWNRVLTWSEAAPILDYEFDDGHGAPECQAITAWTAFRVFFVVQYDGATALHSVPRNPIDHEPEMPGG